ncbi:nucleoside triphosphate pyrophosphohydrolase [Candidatus Uhrbacteria bacterium]|nr:nucleoside triphosphate pyrophosphohydrolase [Candidatus Uhrbacteria bacterium]
MKYNKLIRDKIPDVIREKGGMPVTHVAGDDEYWEKLKEKLREEVGELIADEKMDEIADILEVLEAIEAYKGFDRDEINRIKAKKAEERGAFKQRIILDES